MDNNNELLEYLIKYVDENVSISEGRLTTPVIGQCTEIKLDHNDSNHLTMIVIDDKDELHVYDIWNYDYKAHSWFDGIRKKTLNITMA